LEKGSPGPPPSEMIKATIKDPLKAARASPRAAGPWQPLSPSSTAGWISQWGPREISSCTGLAKSAQRSRDHSGGCIVDRNSKLDHEVHWMLSL